MRVTSGFADDELTIESIRDAEDALLCDDDVGIEHRSASDEGRHAHRQLHRSDRTDE